MNRTGCLTRPVIVSAFFLGVSAKWIGREGDREEIGDLRFSCLCEAHPRKAGGDGFGDKKPGSDGYFWLSEAVDIRRACRVQNFIGRS